MPKLIIIFLSLFVGAALAVEPPDKKSYQYDLVYSIQMAVYDLSETGHSFTELHANIPMLCRIRDNGLFAVYYGVFEGLEDAKQHLGDYDLLYDLNAYVVKLPRVSFAPCASLSKKIQRSRKDAFSERACASCDAQELIDSFLPELGVSPLSDNAQE
jgi:hypothetical protein